LVGSHVNIALGRDLAAAATAKLLCTVFSQMESPMEFSAVLDFAVNHWTYLTIPLISALVGYGTNSLAVKMMMYPIDYVGEGPLGWQGVVPTSAKQDLPHPGGAEHRQGDQPAGDYRSCGCAPVGGFP
jgi:hypothetical protein